MRRKKYIIPLFKKKSDCKAQISTIIQCISLCASLFVYLFLQAMKRSCTGLCSVNMSAKKNSVFPTL